jgi:membrane protein DedA with SNARE-associated domain
MGLTEFIVRYATLVISKTGYVGIGILMTMESMIMPVPSEAVMPFAGFLWFEHKLSFWGIVLASTTGSIIGSLISYCIGAYGGRAFVKKYGKYFLLNEHHLDRTENFFSRHGEITIFISRFIPVVRHLISIPAGLGRMNIVRFSIYTIVGAGLWNSFLTWLGYHLRDNWETIRHYTEVIDLALVAALLAAVGFFIYKQIQSMKRV